MEGVLDADMQPVFLTEHINTYTLVCILHVLLCWAYIREILSYPSLYVQWTSDCTSIGLGNAHSVTNELMTCVLLQWPQRNCLVLTSSIVTGNAVELVSVPHKYCSNLGLAIACYSPIGQWWNF